MTDILVMVGFGAMIFGPAVVASWAVSEKSDAQASRPASSLARMKMLRNMVRSKRPVLVLRRDG
ncbi:hypothetical protein GCM10011507_05980 [Edaphobacter acidisoli]|uniref:Uncharacterized protein n=1 Tax=Edaphobacter acidisoli TaxID=2040573 RepID=A0A916RHK8_9BACT|nr:hypothetical protein GCM10011507_05980 [Edaphobacter acidisoli]